MSLHEAALQGKGAGRRLRRGEGSPFKRDLNGNADDVLLFKG